MLHLRLAVEYLDRNGSHLHEASGGGAVRETKIDGERNRVLKQIGADAEVLLGGHVEFPAHHAFLIFVLLFALGAGLEPFIESGLGRAFEAQRGSLESHIGELGIGVDFDSATSTEGIMHENSGTAAGNEALRAAIEVGVESNLEGEFLAGRIGEIGLENDRPVEREKGSGHFILAAGEGGTKLPEARHADFRVEVGRVHIAELPIPGKFELPFAF